MKSLVDDLLDDWAVHRARQAGEGREARLPGAGAERAAERVALLRDPLDPELATYPDMRKFRAQRSMRDVEPSVGLSRRLDNQPVAEPRRRA